MAQIAEPIDCFTEFPGITRLNEHRRTFQIEGYGNRFRIDLWYSHTNPKAPWVAYVHEHDDGDQWRELPDFAWVQERDEQTAIHQALALLQRRGTSEPA